MTEIPHPELESLLRQRERPNTVLSQPAVRDWLARASGAKGEFCKRIRFAIMREAVGIVPSEFEMKELRVSE